MFTGSAELIGWMVLVVIYLITQALVGTWILMLRLAQYKSNLQDNEDKKGN
jgi:hypothetical protein